MKIAVINLATGKVENLIVASESDPAPKGYLLKEALGWVEIGTPFDGTNFVGDNVTTPPTAIKGLRLA